MDLPIPTTPPANEGDLDQADVGTVTPDSKPVAASETQAQLFPGVHVNVRGVALTILATVAFVFALRAAQRFFIPLTFGIFIAYTLAPLVNALQRLRLPRVVATTVVMISVLTIFATQINSLHTEFNAILDQLPVATRKFSSEMSKLQYGQAGFMQRMQTAATEIEKATSQATTGVQPTVKKTVVSETPVLKLRELLLAGSLGIMDLLSQTVMMLFLIFFLLLSGDKFKRKLVKITGPSLTQKRITVQILGKINTSVQQYMFMLLITNGLLALLTWIAFHLIGLENAGAWALTSGLLHVIPYFGSILMALAACLIAYVQFGTISMALLVAGVSIAIATLVGTVVTTWMTGRITRMNAAAVFISLLFWGWLWGAWGLLLGVPIIVIVKVVAEHVDGMQTVAELLSE
ncbi:AI-2E family transporter [Undibacterium umbellatum]|uniref:AI-2E family transporter n=1 Tax=Undibacterium umbellatum TaxID=2762300 RepID=A0ABR6Z6F9_9BURK|nr:AI-2E family transporter [Undibacterium umbellatum]MBC3907136.1 AI-2E family transporter [Undibacterium umbellatum]